MGWFKLNSKKSIYHSVCVYTVHARIGVAVFIKGMTARLGILWETRGSGMYIMEVRAHSVAVWIYLALDWQVESQESDNWPEGETGRVNEGRNSQTF